MSSTSFLPEEEREAIGREFERLVDEYGSQTKVGVVLGISQAAVNRCITHRVVGPSTARVLYTYLHTGAEELMRKHNVVKKVEPIRQPILTVSPEVSAACNGQSFLSETLHQVELYYRASGKLADAAELLQVAGQYDAINRIGQDRRELSQLRRLHSVPKTNKMA